MEQDKIPISQVINDMCSDCAIVSSAATDYYWLNYKNKEERDAHYAQENAKHIRSVVLFYATLIGLLVFAMLSN